MVSLNRISSLIAFSTFPFGLYNNSIPCTHSHAIHAHYKTPHMLLSRFYILIIAVFVRQAKQTRNWNVSLEEVFNFCSWLLVLSFSSEFWSTRRVFYKLLAFKEETKNTFKKSQFSWHIKRLWKLSLKNQKLVQLRTATT